MPSPIYSDVINLIGFFPLREIEVQVGSNMTGTDLYVNKPHCAAAVRPLRE